MHTRSLARRGWLPALALTLGLLAPGASAQTAQGKTPEFTWLVPPVNAQGVTSLADLQGKLVWVEFWGTY